MWVAWRGGGKGEGRMGSKGELVGRGRAGGGVTYLHCSLAFLLIKTPICVFEVHNESVWLRRGTGRK